MKDERGPIRRRLGPVTLSLVAAVVTAVAFAAISLAASGEKNSQGNTQGNQTGPDNGSQVTPPPPGGAPFGRQDLSDSDKQKLDEFRQCMQDNGAPAPPRPDANSNQRPEPPSAADRAKVQKAYGACKDKLPERLQGQGPPHPPGPCGPPPNGRGQQQGQQGSTQQNQDQSGIAQPPSGAAS